MSAALMDTNPRTPTEPQSQQELPALNATATLTAPARENPLVAIFVGPDGLYPGTRWFIYLGCSGFVLILLLSLVYRLQPRTVPIWWGLVTQATFALAVILPGFFMASLEGQPFAAFGLPFRKAFRRNFWAGTLWGLLWLIVLIGILRLAGVFSFGSIALRPVSIVKFGLYYTAYFLATGFFEEFLMRGYSQWVLAQGMNFWPAAALLSAIFGGLHAANPGETKIGLVGAGLLGLFFCLTLRRTGDLWWAVGFHMSWDWGESFLFSVPDSGGMMPGHLLNSSFHGPAWLTGGSAGPEGSYVVFAVIAAMWVAFDRRYPGERERSKLIQESSS